MNKEEVNWLLQTIQDPENARRFLFAQYQRGRISVQLMNDVAPEPDGINSATLLRWTEHAAMALVLANAW
ncbi:MAG TPA: hypothetical protein VK818_15720 [Methylomirabilota bacterium]|jgi:hypothetical protein|nr:hypothetical protein [Methylomirabilota bacterium]